MKSFLVLLLLPLLALVRGEGETSECNKVRTARNDCTTKAHADYLEAMKKKEDGRPDFAARKACNYLEQAIENCSKHLTDHDCNSEEQVTAMKDGQIKPILAQLDSTIEAWDSCKCPMVKAHIDRVKKAEGVATEEKECPEPEAEPAADGAMMATSTSLLTITFTTFLAIFRLNHL
jgi:hypothetical protein